MRRLKKVYIALLLVLVFLAVSSTPSLADNTQIAYSKIPDDLLTAFANANGRLDVVVWLEDDATEQYQTIVDNISEPIFPNGNANNSECSLQNISQTELTEEERLAQIEETQNYIMQKRQIAQSVYLAHNNEIAAELESEMGEGSVVYVSQYSPLIICNVNLSEAVDIAMNNCVLSLTNGDARGEDALADCESIIGLNSLTTTEHSAAGVTIGMIEEGVPQVGNAQYGLPSNISFIEGFDVSGSLHATRVASIIVSVAPGFNHLYCAGVGTSMDNMIIAAEAMLTANVNVINISWGNPESLCQYDDYARWIDHIAYNHSVHIVAASGNRDDNADAVRSPGSAYNVITVGNTQKNGTLANSSAYNATNSEIAFKPDLCAPGTNITVFGNAVSGTSYSAPQVTGIVAVLCHNAPTIMTKQALMKSILMTSVSTSTNHRYDTTNVFGTNAGYRKYGAGIVNVNNAKNLIDSGNYINTSMSANTDSVTHSLGTIQAGQTVSVTLVFLKRVRIRATDHIQNPTLSESELPRMNVHIRAGSAPSNVTHLMSNEYNDNNVQKLIFTANTTDEYLFVINKIGGDETYETLYAVSWQIESDASN